MTKIILETHIDAPIERVFDLARSIELHQHATRQTNEKAIAGRTFGLIELGETVTWRAKHLGFYQQLTVEIIEFDKPNLFVDVMSDGIFKHMKHTHRFTSIRRGTRMVDEFEFASSLGWLGKLVDALYLKRYLTNFLINKNKELKMTAEGR